MGRYIGSKETASHPAMRVHGSGEFEFFTGSADQALTPDVVAFFGVAFALVFGIKSLLTQWGEAPAFAVSLKPTPGIRQLHVSMHMEKTIASWSGCVTQTVYLRLKLDIYGKREELFCSLKLLRDQGPIHAMVGHCENSRSGGAVPG